MSSLPALLSMTRPRFLAIRLAITPSQFTRVSLLWAGLVAATASLSAATINGFNIDNRSVPATHLVRAAPAKDSIKSLLDPARISPAECAWLADDDEVLSVTMGGVTRAYPLRILVWHEVVNDRIEGNPVLITYSALSGSGLAFDPGQNPDGTRRTFGVSGLLYNSCLLMYDHATESLWSQLRMEGIAGEANGTPLVPLSTRRMPWGLWRKAFPAGEVLSTDTGTGTDYDVEWPYGDYAEDRATIFPFDIHRNEFGTKERMIGYRDVEDQRSWPLEKLRERGEIYDSIGSRMLKVSYRKDTGDVLIQDTSTREVLPAVSVYWFAWQAFYPDTTVWIPL